MRSRLLRLFNGNQEAMTHDPGMAKKVNWLSPLAGVLRMARAAGAPKRRDRRTIKSRAVIVDGVRYESMGDASRAIGITVGAIHYRVQHHVNGARYA